MKADVSATIKTIADADVVTVEVNCDIPFGTDPKREEKIREIINDARKAIDDSISRVP